MYKYINQSSKYTNETFHLKISNEPDDVFIYINLSRTVHSVHSSSSLFMGVLDSKSYRALFGARILALHQYENQRRKEEERLKID